MRPSKARFSIFSLVVVDLSARLLQRFSGRLQMAGRIQPLALIDKCIGSRIWIILKVLRIKIENNWTLWQFISHMEAYNLSFNNEGREGNYWHTEGLWWVREHGSRWCNWIWDNSSWQKRGETHIRCISSLAASNLTLAFMWQTQLDQILLNGANICLLVPGGDPSATSS